MSISFVELRLNSGVHNVLCPYKHTGRGIDVDNTLDSFSSTIKWDFGQPMWRINTNPQACSRRLVLRALACPEINYDWFYMVLIPLTGFNGNPGHITNPSPSRRSHLLNSMEQAISRNTEETHPSTSLDASQRPTQS